MEDTAKPGAGAIPEGLRETLSSLAGEAKGLLGIMHALRPKKGDTDFYRVSAARFKRIASELTHRYDTLAYLVPEDVLSAEAARHGCTWDASSRKFVVKV